MTGDLARYQSELAAYPELVGRILREFRRVAERRRMRIKTDAASVDAAITRSLALAAGGIESRLEFTS
jgi:hypothetical protein